MQDLQGEAADGVEVALGRLMGIIESLARLRLSGRDVVLVSSGAVGGTGSLTVNSLALGGSTVSLTAGNFVDTLAGGVGTISFNNNGNLAIGSLAGYSGLTITGGAGSLQVTGSLTVNNAINASAVAGSLSIKANDMIVAAGTNMVNAGNGTLTLAPLNIAAEMFIGQATGSGSAAFFQISNPPSTSSAMNVTTNAIGSGVTVQLTNVSNGARGVDVNQSGVGPGVFAVSAGGNAVWGITSAISAAGVIGDNTFGEAVVGRNRGGNGVGAVVGRNDDAGYGVRGFNTKTGIGVIGQAGILAGTGIAGYFENVNAANSNNVLVSTSNGTGVGLVVGLSSLLGLARWRLRGRSARAGEALSGGAT